MKGNNFEKIKNRMIDKAATLWGVSASDIESSFDPVVSLLISSCAMEIEKISNEVDESKVRITERLIQLMTPDSVYGPKAANAIMHIDPIDERISLKEESLFYYKKKISHNNSVSYKNLFFSPTQEFNLVNASVKYVLANNKLIEFTDKKRKETLVNNSSKISSTSIYIGVDSFLPKINLSNISFYFEPSGADNLELFYQGLANTTWETEDGQLKVYNGLKNEATNIKNQLDSIFEEVSSLSNTICDLTNNYYGKRFVTLADKKVEKLKDSTFSVVEDFINNSKAKIEGNIRWIKVTFPSGLNSFSFEDIFCSLNSFPVINRELNSFSYRINEFLNILPIKTEDLFLDIKSIINTNNQQYKDRSVKQIPKSKGTFIVRRDNVGKLDQRRASEYLKMLIEMLKDESASFSLYNNDFLQSNLKELNQLISSLEKKVNETTNNTEETIYAILKPYRKKENLLVEFWSTNGVLANNLKPESNIEVYKAIGVKHQSGYLVTVTQGGKDNQSMADRLNAYRSSLLSRDRIVTKEDVKSLCFELFSQRIENVSINKKLYNSMLENKGLVQCIEISLFANKNIQTEPQEWDSLKSNLLYYLEKKSLNVFPYKIKIVS